MSFSTYPKYTYTTKFCDIYSRAFALSTYILIDLLNENWTTFHYYTILFRCRRYVTKRQLKQECLDPRIGASAQSLFHFLYFFILFLAIMQS